MRKQGTLVVLFTISFIHLVIMDSLLHCLPSLCALSGVAGAGHHKPIYLVQHVGASRSDPRHMQYFRVP
jgi:hypothetical protein